MTSPAMLEGLPIELLDIIARTVFEQSTYSIDGLDMLYPLGCSHPLLAVNRAVRQASLYAFYTTMRFHAEIDLGQFDYSTGFALQQAWSNEQSQAAVRCIVLSFTNEDSPKISAMAHLAHMLATTPWFQRAQIVDSFKCSPQPTRAQTSLISLMPNDSWSWQQRFVWSMRQIGRQRTEVVRLGDHERTTKAKMRLQQVPDLSFLPTDPDFCMTQQAVFLWMTGHWFFQVDYRIITERFWLEEVYRILIYRQALGYYDAALSKHIVRPDSSFLLES